VNNNTHAMGTLTADDFIVGTRWHDGQRIRRITPTGWHVEGTSLYFTASICETVRVANEGHWTRIDTDAPGAKEGPRPTADPIAKVAALVDEVRNTGFVTPSGRVSVDRAVWTKLVANVSALSAGKVAKPAALDKPSAAANQVEAHTAVEAAEPAPSDPLAQAMSLIPNTYVEDANNICAAISNMVNDLDRFRRHTSRALEDARKAEGRANDAVKRATQAEENLLTCRMRIESLERETRTFPAKS